MPPPLTYKSIGVFSRPRPSALAEIVPQLLAWLKQRGVTVVYDAETANVLNRGELGRTRQEVVQQAELLLVLGGDGTIIAASREAAPRGIPILPINLGGLG